MNTHRTAIRFGTAALFAAGAAVLEISLAGVSRAQTVTEFPIPTANSGPGGVAAGPDGNLWFTEGSANQIGRITTAGVVTEFPVPIRPAGIVAGPDGNLWFTEGGGNKIGRITTAGVVTEFPLAAGRRLISFTNGPDGNLWFTASPFPVIGRIGRITPDGVITEFAGPNYLRKIAAGPDGNLWFTSGNSIGMVGRITPEGGITEFTIPPPGSSPSAIAAGPDGKLWFTYCPEFACEVGRIGRVTTDGVFDESLPAASSTPTAFAVGPDDNLWFTEYSGNRIGRITTSGVITEFAIPTSDSNPSGIAAGPDGNLWFTESASNMIGRITTNCGDTTTLCLGGGRFQVTAHWEVPSRNDSGDGTAGSGAGTAVSLTADSGYFWFFDSKNVEVVVKVLNACSTDGGHFWVFAGGLTNVGVTLSVTDMQTLVVRTYTNPAGIAFEPIQDTSAFSTCP